MKRLLIILLLIVFPCQAANYIIGEGVTTTIDGTDRLIYKESTGGLGAITWTNILNSILASVPAGPQGPQGVQGAQGPAGPQGPAGDPASNIITSVNGQTGVVSLDAADVGAQTLLSITIEQWLEMGGVLPARSDSAICDPLHPNYNTVNTFLSGVGLNDSNIECSAGWPALGPVITMSGQSMTLAYGALGVSAPAGAQTIGMTAQEMVSAYGGFSATAPGSPVTITLTAQEMTSAYGGMTVSAAAGAATITITSQEMASAYGAMGVTAGSSETTIYATTTAGKYAVVHHEIQNGGWATVRNATTGVRVDTDLAGISAAYLADDGGQDWTWVERMFVEFDFASLAGEIISSAILTVTTDDVLSPVGSPVLSAQQGTQTTLNTAAYNDFTGNTFGQTAAATATNTEYMITLNADGLAYLNTVVGSTGKICVREYAHDYVGTSPSSGVNHWTSIQLPGTNATATKLTITHHH